MMDYATLTGAKSTNGSIKSWINHSLIPAEEIVEDAEAFIYSQLRVREMRAYSTLTLAAGVHTVPAPLRFKDPIALTNSYGQMIDLVDETDWLRGKSRDSDGAIVEGIPTIYTIIGDTLMFDFKVESSSVFEFVYYNSPAPLSNAAGTNFLTSRYPHILRKTCLMHAADYLKDEASRASYEKEAIALIQSANAESDLSRRGADYSRKG